MCTLEKRGRVYLLTLTGDGNEHRLNPSLLHAIRSALARILSDPSATRGSALVTAAEGKYFSNGLDIAWAEPSPSDRLQLMCSSLQLAIADIISLPMPTIAAVTGHASAAGCMLALAHDHVLMRADRGFLYMSEMDMGTPIPGYFAALLRTKISDPRALRDLALQSVKVTAAEAVRMGIVDRAIDGAGETVEAAVELGEEMAGRMWDGWNYASMRKLVFPEVSRAVGLKEEDAHKVFLAKLRAVGLKEEDAHKVFLAKL